MLDMMSPRVILLFCLGISLAGCRTPRDLEILQRQNRKLEDRVHELEWENDDLAQDLENCQARSVSTSERSPRTRGPRSSVREEELPKGRSRETRPKDGSSPPGDADVPEIEIEIPETRRGDSRVDAFVGLPEIQPPDPSIPEGEPLPGPKNQPRLSGVSPGDDSETSESEALGPGGVEGSLPDPNAGASGSGEQVAVVTLNRRFTGVKRGATGGPSEGLLVVLEPRDAAGHLIQATGEVSFAAVDPSKKSLDEGRLARWDFSAEAAGMHFKETALSKGMHFELDWPDAPPGVDSVNLYVRFKTADGRNLDALGTIDLKAKAPRAELAVSPAAEPRAKAAEKPNGLPSAKGRAGTPRVRPRSDQPRARGAPIPLASKPPRDRSNGRRKPPRGPAPRFDGAKETAPGDRDADSGAATRSKDGVGEPEPKDARETR